MKLIFTVLALLSVNIPLICYSSLLNSEEFNVAHGQQIGKNTSALSKDKVLKFTTPDYNKFDLYLRGYIQSIFINSYGLPSNAVTVREGVILIDNDKLQGNNPQQILEKVKQATASIKGVKDVQLISYSTTNSNLSKLNIIDPSNIEENETRDIAMPTHSLFQALIADNRWPRFTLSYQYFLKAKLLKHAFAPNFGASFPLYKVVNQVTNREWEVGIQAGLFGLLDIGTNPTALINADYYIAVPVTYRSGPWSGLVRLYHQSSHLGDEFMLTEEGKKTKRINLSYEGIDVLLSYNFDILRIYGGGGYIIHRDPSYIKRGKIQVGVEYYSQSTFMNGQLRPLIGVDMKAEALSSWTPGISCKAGVQLENSALISNKVQLMLEYYSGKSMHGQFYKNKIKYIGVGVQAFL